MMGEGVWISGLYTRSRGPEAAEWVNFGLWNALKVKAEAFGTDLLSSVFILKIILGQLKNFLNIL